MKQSKIHSMRMIATFVLGAFLSVAVAQSGEQMVSSEIASAGLPFASCRLDQTTKIHVVDDTVYRSRHISGIVVDPTGAPIPNAKVRIRKDGVEVASANTDHNGIFSFKKLDFGEYELAVQAFAFNEARYHVAVVKKSTKSEDPLRIKLRLAPLPGPVEVEPSKH